MATSLNNNPGTVTEVKPGGTYLIKFGDGNLDSVIARNDVSLRLPNIHTLVTQFLDKRTPQLRKQLQTCSTALVAVTQLLTAFATVNYHLRVEVFGELPLLFAVLICRGWPICCAVPEAPCN